jgi:hypothetical protein
VALSLLFAIMDLSGPSFFSLPGFGGAYLVLAPVFHFFTYEVRNENEYYFYYNMGLSKPVLWLATLLISSIIGLTCMAL